MVVLVCYDVKGNIISQIETPIGAPAVIPMGTFKVIVERTENDRKWVAKIKEERGF